MGGGVGGESLLSGKISYEDFKAQISNFSVEASKLFGVLAYKRGSFISARSMIKVRMPPESCTAKQVLP